MLISSFVYIHLKFFFLVNRKFEYAKLSYLLRQRSQLFEKKSKDYF